MKLLRRRFLHLAAVVAALPVVSRRAWAQAYPTRPVRIIVPFPPAGTPSAIIDKLNATITAGLADPQLKAKIKDLGGEPMPMTPVEFGKFLAAETEKWGKVVKFSGIKPN